MSGRRDSTCQKHELPKSLQGTEDAEFVWNMITDRFPNAAPLLCEMEAVMDRAEDLLQQLRAPCREMETSTSFCTHDSEESTLMISARGSLTTENDNTEECGNINKSTAEMQVSETSIEEDFDFNDNSLNSVFKEQCIESLSSDSSMIHHSKADKTSSDKLDSDSAELNMDQVTKEARSLEGWGKIVDYAMRGCMGGDQYVKSTNYEQNKAERLTGTEHDRESCITLHRQQKSDDVGNSLMEIDSGKTGKNNKMIESKDIAMNTTPKGSGDKSSITDYGQRTPLSILEEYATRCNSPVQYDSSTHKPNVCVIRGNLAGFAATSQGDSECNAKNNLAVKILQMIANQQIMNEKHSTLVELTREEMMEIFNFPMDGLSETGQRKVYQLCLEQRMPIPMYRVDKVKTFKGFSYVATCSALGYTCKGRSVRECMAKKSAADELYHKYRQDHMGELKVNFLDFLCQLGKNF